MPRPKAPGAEMEVETEAVARVLAQARAAGARATTLAIAGQARELARVAANPAGFTIWTPRSDLRARQAQASLAPAPIRISSAAPWPKLLPPFLVPRTQLLVRRALQANNPRQGAPCRMLAVAWLRNPPKTRSSVSSARSPAWARSVLAEAPAWPLPARSTSKCRNFPAVRRTR